MSPTARTLQKLRKDGYIAEIVERWNPWSKTRHDLFNCIDVLGIHSEHGIKGIQATSASNHSARTKKIKSNPCFVVLKKSIALEVWSWGKKKGRWQVRIERM